MKLRVAIVVVVSSGMVELVFTDLFFSALQCLVTSLLLQTSLDTDKETVH